MLYHFCRLIHSPNHGEIHPVGPNDKFDNYLLRIIIFSHQAHLLPPTQLDLSEPVSPPNQHFRRTQTRPSPSSPETAPRCATFASHRPGGSLPIPETTASQAASGASSQSQHGFRALRHGALHAPTSFTSLIKFTFKDFCVRAHSGNGTRRFLYE